MPQLYLALPAAASTPAALPSFLYRSYRLSPKMRGRACDAVTMAERDIFHLNDDCRSLFIFSRFFTCAVLYIPAGEEGEETRGRTAQGKQEMTPVPPLPSPATWLLGLLSVLLFRLTLLTWTRANRKLRATLLHYGNSSALSALSCPKEPKIKKVKAKRSYDDT